MIFAWNEFILCVLFTHLDLVFLLMPLLIFHFCKVASAIKVSNSICFRKLISGFLL